MIASIGPTIPSSGLVRISIAVSGVVLILVAGGCGPQPPKVLLEAPREVSAEYRGRRLFHTPQAFIYARSAESAGEADRWVRDVQKYIKRNFKRELEKGLVVVMDPGDPPVAATLEDAHLLERDPAIMVTRPRHARSVAEVRKKMAAEGLPEPPMLKGMTLVLPPRKRVELQLSTPETTWAAVAPSHALAVECGIDVGAAGLRKKRPDWSEEQARKAASMFKDSFAKAFEIGRGNPVFIAWVQRQSDWSDEQRREAIRKYLRNVFTSNWLPPPKEEDLEW
ncbi:MAG TPA: hypothetical protein VJZ71_19675 [Phycisphaerae bacterium]|nr:hypothetical protein [Phycisphaerae bacterium]